VKLTSIQETITRALQSAGLIAASRSSTPPMVDPLAKALASPSKSKQLFERMRQQSQPQRSNYPAPQTRSGVSDASLPGQFLQLTQPAGAGNRMFKLYVPSCFIGQSLPLVLMLHGCKQNPDDFATGTRMNEFAEREGFFVAYPAQTARDNGANCWNWFDPAQQTRDGAEPASLVGMIERLRIDYNVDGSRVFVAGLSAGAAMAVILGASYPEIFAGVAAHSGLPLGAARDVGSAFAVMKTGNTPTRSRFANTPVPTLVFHGNADTTVASDNGRNITNDAVAAYRDANIQLHECTELLSAADALKSAMVTRHVDNSRRVHVEHWTVSGAGHAWFGGDPKGSYTDPTAPDASSAIVNFFLKSGRAEELA
jgi:poly(hydroxyalkanoate) depolymerase family esterase